MAERLNDEQLKSIRDQMKRRAYYSYERAAIEMIATGDSENPLINIRLSRAQRLKDIAYGIGIVLGEESIDVDLGLGKVEEFNPDLKSVLVPESEWWRSFKTGVEEKQILPNIGNVNELQRQEGTQ